VLNACRRHGSFTGFLTCLPCENVSAQRLSRHGSFTQGAAFSLRGLWCSRLSASWIVHTDARGNPDRQRRAPRSASWIVSHGGIACSFFRQTCSTPVASGSFHSRRRSRQAERCVAKPVGVMVVALVAWVWLGIANRCSRLSGERSGCVVSSAFTMRATDFTSCYNGRGIGIHLRQQGR